MIKVRKLTLMHRHFQLTLILMNIETANCARTGECSLENTLPCEYKN